MVGQAVSRSGGLSSRENLSPKRSICSGGAIVSSLMTSCKALPLPCISLSFRLRRCLCSVVFPHLRDSVSVFAVLRSLTSKAHFAGDPGATASLPVAAFPRCCLIVVSAFRSLDEAVAITALKHGHGAGAVPTTSPDGGAILTQDDGLITIEAVPRSDTNASASRVRICPTRVAGWCSLLRAVETCLIINVLSPSIPEDPPFQ